MKLRFRQDRPGHRGKEQKAIKALSPFPPWIILPELERLRRRPLPMEPQHQPEIPAGPVVIPIMPDDTQDEKKTPKRGVIIIEGSPKRRSDSQVS